ncbi:hypothetical protein APSETT444_007350 [Aspergillus pseudonomiae]
MQKCLDTAFEAGALPREDTPKDKEIRLVGFQEVADELMVGLLDVAERGVAGHKKMKGTVAKRLPGWNPTRLEEAWRQDYSSQILPIAMASLQIPDEALVTIKDKAILITGGSSGIGRATAELCLQLGAKVVIGDLNPAPDDLSSIKNLKFIKADTTSWDSLRNLFNQAVEAFGRIDHVFANAGIGPKTDFLDESLDENGELAPPDMQVLNVNLNGVIYTTRLAVHYFRKFAGQHDGAVPGSIVLTASASSFQAFGGLDYATAKHGVLGLMRGLVGRLPPSVRVNAIAPSWTVTGLVSADFLASLGMIAQGPEVVARSVVLLFTDSERNGHLIYSWEGKYKEIDKAEGGLLSAAKDIIGIPVTEGEVFQKMEGRSSNGT